MTVQNLTQHEQDIREAAILLHHSPDHRVLTRLNADEIYEYGPKDYSPLNVIIVDVETTGLDWHTDEIIELGLVQACFDTRTGELIAGVNDYDWFEQPKAAIPAEITALTGITDDMVASRTFPNETIDFMVQTADLVIAHNAKFDRPFLEQRFTCFVEKHWACSIEDIDWKGAHGFSSASLDYLAYKHGFFFDAHRAVNDCLALTNILRLRGEGDRPRMLELLTNTRRSLCKVWAVNAPFSTKDGLKDRKYHWDTANKTWCKTIASDALEAEQEWLARCVYGGRARIRVDSIYAFDRFTDRVSDSATRWIS